MKYTITSIIIMIMVLGNACEQENITTLKNRTAVVDAYLYAGKPVDSVQITHSFSYASDDTVLVTLDNLEVFLYDGAKSHPLTNVGQGFYQNQELIIKAGHVYNLEFTFEGEDIFAETFVPEQPQATISTTTVRMNRIEANNPFGGGGFNFDVEPIDISWENSEGNYYYVLVKNMEDDPEYINSIFENADLPQRRFSFITSPEITDFFSIDPRRQLQQFGTHQVIVFRVNPEYAALYGVSGVSSLTITQAPTNIENGLGIFTGVSSDTLIFEVEKR